MTNLDPARRPPVTTALGVGGAAAAGFIHVDVVGTHGSRTRTGCAAGWSHRRRLRIAARDGLPASAYMNVAGGGALIIYAQDPLLRPHSGEKAGVKTPTREYKVRVSI